MDAVHQRLKEKQKRKGEHELEEKGGRGKERE